LRESDKIGRVARNAGAGGEGRTPAAPVLVLAGTAEATALARRLHASGRDVVSSLAGITSNPTDRPGRVRRGGFGGVDGLISYLVSHGIAAVVDATHPFAAVMPFHAQSACAAAGVPLCRLLREPWRPGDGDEWIDVDGLDAAAAAIERIGARRVLLATGRQSLAPFATCERQWFLARSIEAVADPPANMTTIQDRGPYTVEAERALIAAHEIDTLVTKNAGGEATAAKLAAARDAGVRVVMVRRPSQPPGVYTVTTVGEAQRWVEAVLTRRS
jgi:precorrin-6A/cobalt-precorrin-6A reductase